MTWYHNGKDISYDRDTDYAHIELWGYIVGKHGSEADALCHLFTCNIASDHSCMHELFSLVSKMCNNSDDVDCEDFQSLVDDAICDYVILPRDCDMAEQVEADPQDRFHELAGLRFEWRED